MASNIIKEERNASDSSYAEDDKNKLEIFDENGNSVDRNVHKVVSKVPLIKRRGKRGKRKAIFFRFYQMLPLISCSESF